MAASPDQLTTTAAEQKKIKVKTTLPHIPLPPLSTRQPLETPRLRLIPINQDLLPDYHWIRTTPSNMVHSNQGRPDNDISETQRWMDRFVPPGDQETYAFAIKQKEPAAGSERDDDEQVSFETRAIGMMGIVRLNRGTGWPEVGYGINETHHGRGYATELLAEVLRFWWSLPREEVVVEMERRYVFDALGGDGVDGELVGAGGEDDVVEMRERVVAIADADNVPSLRVMEKVGFKRFMEFVDEEDDPPVPLAACWLLRPSEASG